MGADMVLTNDNQSNFDSILADIKIWCENNKIVVGVGEIALGASLIAWGVHNGVIEMGSQIFATQLGGENIESIVGALGGSGIGAIAGYIIGGIGVVGMGTGIGIPAALLMSGAAAVFSLFGYTAGDLIHNFMHIPVDFADFAANGSLLLIGLALIVHGARTCIGDDKILPLFAQFKDGVINLKGSSSKIIASTIEELNSFTEEFLKIPETKQEITASASTASAGAIGGAVAGTALAASSVSVLGSSTLGGVAISLGIVSAPVWPIIAGVAGGAGLGYTAYKAFKYWRNNKESESEAE